MERLGPYLACSVLGLPRPSERPVKWSVWCRSSDGWIELKFFFPETFPTPCKTLGPFGNRRSQARSGRSQPRSVIQRDPAVRSETADELVGSSSPVRFASDRSVRSNARSPYSVANLVPSSKARSPVRSVLAPSSPKCLKPASDPGLEAAHKARGSPQILDFLAGWPGLVEARLLLLRAFKSCEEIEESRFASDSIKRWCGEVRVQGSRSPIVESEKNEAVLDAAVVAQVV